MTGHALSQSFCDLLINVSIRAALLMALVSLALRLANPRRASVRHWVWVVTLAGMLSLPVLTLVLPSFPVPVSLGRALAHEASPDLAPGLFQGEPPEVGSPWNPSSTDRPAGGSFPVVADLREARHQEPGELAGLAASISFATLILAVYLAGLAAMVLYLIGGMVASRRLQRTATAVAPEACGTIADHLFYGSRYGRRSPVLWSSPAARVPLTLGWLRPKILLPADWCSWDRQKLEAILHHEMAHVRRRDGLVRILSLLNRCLYWFHPAAWMLWRRLNLVAELACDESALRFVPGPRYASLLLEIASHLRSGGGRVALHHAAMARPSQVSTRIEAILNPEPCRGLGRSGLAVVISLAAVTWVSAASVRIDTSAGRVTPEPAAAVSRTQEAAIGGSGHESPAATGTPRLEERIAWALARGSGLETADSYWVAYAVPPAFGPTEAVASSSEPEETGARRLYEQVERAALAPGAGGLRQSSGPAPVVFLFRLPVDTREVTGAEAIKIRSAALPADLGELPLLWLGTFEDASSRDFLSRLYPRLESPRLRAETAAALAVHRPSAAAVAALGEILDREDHPVARKEAAYWAGAYQPSQETLKLLVELLRTDPDPEVREEALGGLGLIHAAALAAASRGGEEPRGLRGVAGAHQILELWSGGVVDLLSAMIYEDPDQAVRREALDLLSRSRDDQSLQLLAEIAAGHSESRMRRDAAEALVRTTADDELVALLQNLREAY